MSVGDGGGTPRPRGPALLSARTVERAKRRLASDLGVRGRAAAAAFAEAHGLSIDLQAGRPTLLEELPAPTPGRLRVMLFEDIVESTPLNELLGDQQYVELLTRHDSVVHGTIRRMGGGGEDRATAFRIVRFGCRVGS